MRGVLSGGGAVALSHLGFNELFDEVYATSAGVMNVSYFLRGRRSLASRFTTKTCGSTVLEPASLLEDARR